MKITDRHFEVMWYCLVCPEVMPQTGCVFEKYRDRMVLGKTDMVEQLTAEVAFSLVKAHEKCLQERSKETLQENVHGS